MAIQAAVIELAEEIGIECIETLIPQTGFVWARLRPVHSRSLKISPSAGQFLIDPAILALTDSLIERLDPPDDEGETAPPREVYPFVGAVVPIFDRLGSMKKFGPDGFLAFANKYGSLGLETWAATAECQKETMPAPLGRPKGQLILTPGDSYFTDRYGRDPWVERTVDSGIVFGDSIMDWVEVSQAMQMCVELFRFLLRDEGAGLESLFTVRDKYVVCRSSPLVRLWNAIEFDEKEEFADGDNTDPNTLAGLAIQEVVNRFVFGQCVTTVKYNIDENSFSFVNRPHSFRHAIWFEFAEALHHISSFRECLRCGHLFRVGEDGSIDSRLRCGATCRMAALRARHKRACELRRGGMHLRAIAKELDADLKTVTAWVKDVPMP